MPTAWAVGQIGGDPVNQEFRGWHVARAMPMTAGAADQAFRSAARADAHRAVGDLLLGLAGVECSFAIGGTAAVSAGMLRDLVILTGRLIGPAVAS